ncbi:MULTISPECIES: protein kinase [unclassified Nodularia (in: cyanobacteria)]|uniref:protein kinase domain-containing protein n=1 Tax=unclassified Nodularia (in: cyanobacteria) TaxID=2656917 RepID=UPI00187DF4A5|nr:MULTISPECIES: protein kinase [unclassified Nodularia (in: cyanobacteria)]MBE9199990.1 protein kinase [Nodularia sp. LEGE 06071]MCC2693628.1 protein kinase [Nodularia sp. LEGE 04288]
MAAQATLTIIKGKLPGRQYTFDSRTTCIIGRSSECNIQLPNDADHLTISRYQCLLDINPPNIRIRDFGSKNGTYVNGEKIGQRGANQTPEKGAKLQFPEYDLKCDDEIKLGNTVFAVHIEADPEELNIPNFSLPTIDHNQSATQAPNFLAIIKRWLGLAAQANNQFLAIQGYNIIKLLGRGGFGEVYLAQHNNSGKFIALKVMLPAIIGNENAVQRFLRETENTKVLQHPHVIQVIDYGFFENIFFFTMEYCAGGTVADLMAKYGGKLPVNIAVPIIMQVLNGLEYSHNAEIPYVKLKDGGFGKGKGLVHRDLKPGNILLNYTDDKITAKIADYGLAKAFDLAGLSGQTLSGSQAGTPAFIPRQQLLNFKYVQPEVDIWATAASLYNMLTGELPRNLTNDPFLAVLQNDPVPIRQRNANIPKKLAEVIDLGLVEKPEIYFKSAVDFKSALLDSYKTM